MYHVKGKVYPCCTSVTMGLIGGKWKTVILYYLIKEPQRYSQLRKLMPTVTERTLSLQLKALEQDGLLVRQVYTDQSPLRVEYSLTALGQSVIPLLHAMAQWGNDVAAAVAE